MTPGTTDHIKWDARGSVVVQRDCTKRQEHVGIDGHREVSFQFQFDLVTVDWGAYLRMLRMLACVGFGDRKHVECEGEQFVAMHSQ